MRTVLYSLSLILSLSGCASTYKAPSYVLAAKCEDTPVKVSDFEQLGFTAAPGKVVVIRLMRINCPFCKEDLLRIASFYQNGTWDKDKVHLFLIAYRKEGVEDRKTFDNFMREELPNLGIPMEAVQATYIDKDYYALVKAKGKKGELLFEGWKAVPFGLVMGTDGRLAYRGHFTNTAKLEDSHYQFVTSLQKETCPPKSN